MPYAKNPTWQDSPSPSTPITAAALNHLEDGVQAASDVPVTAVAAAGAAQTLTAGAVPLTVYDLTLSANCTLSLGGGTAGYERRVKVYLRQDATAGRAVTLPAGVKWAGGQAPTPGTAAGNVDVFVFTTPDGGATWFGDY